MPSRAVAAIIPASFFWRIMAGHSKWANIQHRKGAQDSRRGKGPQQAYPRALGGDAHRWIGSGAPTGVFVSRWTRRRPPACPQDQIEQAITAPPAGEQGAELHAVRYEGYGPGGVAVMVDCVTDNHGRTVSDVRHAFSSCGGSLGAVGSVAYLFNQVGLMTFPAGTSEDRLMEVALQAGAEDVLAHTDGSMEVLTDPLDYETVRARLAADGFTPTTGEITQRASTCTRASREDAESMVQLLDTLDDLDDVQNVYSNAEIPDEVLARV